MIKLPKCKITIIKKTLHEDLIDKYIVDKYRDFGLCEKFDEGQEFIFDPTMPIVPENFCPWAWADIRGDITLISSGGSLKWFKQPEMTIVACTDYFRPVYFKIERLE